MAAPVVGTVLGAAISGATPSISSVQTTGTNRGLLVVLGWYENTAQALPDSVSYNSVAMVLVDNYDGGTNTSRAAVYKYDGEPADTTANVTTVFSASPSGYMWAIPLTGVDTAAPTGTSAKSGGTSREDTNTAAVSGSSDYLMIDVCSIFSKTLTLGGSQTSLGDNVGGGQRVSTSSKAGAASVTMSQSWTGATTDWGHIVVPVKGVGGGGAALEDDSGAFPGFEAQSNPLVISVW